MTQYDSIGWRNGATCVRLAVLSVLARCTRRLPNIFDERPIDPDRHMCLDCLRNTLESHRPMDLLTGAGSGHGTLAHWSHLLDGLARLHAAPFCLVLAPAGAVLAASNAIGAFGNAVALTAAPFADERRLNRNTVPRWLQQVAADADAASGNIYCWIV